VTEHRDSDALLAAYLADGMDVLPDRVVDAVLDEAHRTRQRAVFGPGRTRIMFKPVFGAAAVIAVLVIGGAVWLGAFGSRGSIGGLPSTPFPSASPSQAPSSLPAPSPSNLTPGRVCTATDCLSGTLDPGTYTIDAGKITPQRLSFTVPAGWAIDTSGFVTKHADAPGEVLFTAWIVSHVYGDVCHWTGTLVDAGTTTAQLTSALVAQKGRSASAPTDVTIGGYRAKRVSLTVPPGLDVTTCDRGLLRFWPDPGPDESGGLPCRSAGCAGSTDVVSIVDVAGARFTVVARHQLGGSPGDVAELDAIVASIKIDRPGTSPSPSGASPSQ
jgi:hypothetical protein